MEGLFALICIPVFIPLLIVIYDLGYFIVTGNYRLEGFAMTYASFMVLIIYPFLYISYVTENDCCGDTATFSKDHVVSIVLLITAYNVAYWRCLRRNKVQSPIAEITFNCLLLIGIIFNIFVAIHTDSLALAAIGNFPGIILLLSMLIRNQLFLTREIEMPDSTQFGFFGRTALKILYSPALIKFPILLVVCVPIMIVFISFLLLFGQKPDSLIRAFTDTYKHGFSQLNHECDNVQCGGHYLCSVAANGHTGIVKPERLGIRNGNPIICNRQLLVSNAFEELLEERLPKLHRFIRHNYNKVGNMVHRHYGIFSNKFVSDFVYIIMKPAEWLFLLALYTFDTKPENRIARQYLKPEEKILLKGK